MKLLMTIAIAAAVLVCGAGPQAAEITLGASGPMREALSLLAPVFARKTGHKIEILYASDAEARAATARGEDVDAAIVASPFESVLGSAHVLADSRTDLARVRLGMAVRSKAPRPDVSTPDALRRTLLDSPRIVFPARIQPPAANVISRMSNVHPNRSPGLARAPGKSRVTTKRNIMIPNSRPDQRT